MPQKIICSNTTDLKSIANSLLECINNHKIFLVYGQMGAGKTTFIKAVCNQLGVHDHMSSPTFSIVNEYRISGTKQPVYHMDFYRIKNINELYNIGIEEYLDSGFHCFIEWPELYENLISCPYFKINITVNDDVRIFTF